MIMAIRTYVDTAHQICVFTAFSLVPRNRLIRRCCLIHLKNNSTCQRLLYSAAIVSAGKVVLLVKKTNVLPDSGSLKRMRRMKLINLVGLSSADVRAIWRFVDTPNSPLPDLQSSSGYCAALYPQMAPPNPPCGASTGPEGPTYAARSRHPGGVNVLMCDGSVKFIKNSINLAVWRALSTTQGNEVISSDAY